MMKTGRISRRVLEVVLEGVDKVVKGVINLQTVLLSKPHFVFL